MEHHSDVFFLMGSIHRTLHGCHVCLSATLSY